MVPMGERERTDLMPVMIGGIILAPLVLLAAGDRWIDVSNMDVQAEWEPYREFAVRTLAAGELPAWCPGLAAGIPFIAWAHAGAYSPFNLLSFFLPFHQAATVSLFLTAAIYAVGLYWLIRNFSGSRPASAAGSLMATGLFLETEQCLFSQRLLPLGLSPLVFLLFIRLLERRQLKYLLGLAATACLQVFNGGLEMSARCLLLGTMVACLHHLASAGIPGWRHRLALIAASASLILLLALAQLLPFFELVAHSTRRLASGKEIFLFFADWRACTPILYFLTDSPFLILAFFILPFTRYRPKRSFTPVLMGCACLIIAFNLGHALVLLQHLPVVNRMFWHTYMLQLGAVPFAICAGLMIDWLISTDRRVSTLALIVCAGVILLKVFLCSAIYFGSWEIAGSIITPAILTLTAALTFLRGQRQTWLVTALVSGSLVMAGTRLHLSPPPFDNYRGLARLHSSLPDPSRTICWHSDNFVDHQHVPYQAGIHHGTESFDFSISVLPLPTFEMLQLIQPFRTTLNIGSVFHIFHVFKHGDFITAENLKFINLLNVRGIVADHVNFKFQPDYHFAYSQEECFAPACVITSQATTGRGSGIRVRTPYRLQQDIFLPPGSVMETGLGGGDRDAFFVVTTRKDRRTTLRLARFCPAETSAYLARKTGRTGFQADMAFAAVPNNDRPGTALWDDPRVFRPGMPFHLVRRESDTGYYTNRNALPRAFIVHDLRVIPDKDRRLEYMKSQAFDPVVTVVVEEGNELHLKTRRTIEPVVFVTRSNSREIMSATLHRPGVLVLSETYYPGWRAWVDGRETRIERADHALRAVRLTPGVHDITFVFDSIPVRIGIFSTLCTLACGLAIPVARLAGSWRKHRRLRRPHRHDELRNWLFTTAQPACCFSL